MMSAVFLAAALVQLPAASPAASGKQLQLVRPVPASGYPKRVQPSPVTSSAPKLPQAPAVPALAPEPVLSAPAKVFREIVRTAVPIDTRPIIVIHGDPEKVHSPASLGFAAGDRGHTREFDGGCTLTQIAPESPRGGVRSAECVRSSSGF